MATRDNFKHVTPTYVLSQSEFEDCNKIRNQQLQQQEGEGVGIGWGNQVGGAVNTTTMDMYNGPEVVDVATGKAVAMPHYPYSSAAERNNGNKQNWPEFARNMELAQIRSKPADYKVFSLLDREIQDILQDTTRNTDDKVSDYLFALRRYLTFKDKLYPINPVMQWNRQQMAAAAATSAMMPTIPATPFITPQKPATPTSSTRRRRTPFTTPPELVTPERTLIEEQLLDRPASGVNNQRLLERHRQMVDAYIVTNIKQLGNKPELNLSLLHRYVPVEALAWDYRGNVHLNGTPLKDGKIIRFVQNMSRAHPVKMKGYNKFVEVVTSYLPEPGQASTPPPSPPTHIPIAGMERADVNDDEESADYEDLFD